jgi:hypothetical protein
MTKLETLEFSGLTNLTGAGLQTLAAHLTKLTKLSLYDCVNLTDDGLLPLAALVNLEFLVVNGCPLLTEAGKHSLQHLLPTLAVNLNSAMNMQDY